MLTVVPVQPVLLFASLLVFFSPCHLLPPSTLLPFLGEFVCLHLPDHRTSIVRNSQGLLPIYRGELAPGQIGSTLWMTWNSWTGPLSSREGQRHSFLSSKFYKSITLNITSH